MSKVFISRPDGNVPWGFRLQGGLESNEPLTLTNVSRLSILRIIDYFDIYIHQSFETGKQLSYR
jgi:hypothetical protein